MFVCTMRQYILPVYVMDMAHFLRLCEHSGEKRDLVIDAANAFALSVKTGLSDIATSCLWLLDH